MQNDAQIDCIFGFGQMVYLSDPVGEVKQARVPKTVMLALVLALRRSAS